MGGEGKCAHIRVLPSTAACQSLALSDITRHRAVIRLAKIVALGPDIGNLYPVIRRLHCDLHIRQGLTKRQQPVGSQHRGIFLQRRA